MRAMRIDKSDINVFLALWIKTDPELWAELRDIQIKLLVDRIVKEKSYQAMSQEHGVDRRQIRKIVWAIYEKIEYSISREISFHLKRLDTLIENKGRGPQITLDLDTINLN